jgi:cysteine desulfurase
VDAAQSFARLPELPRRVDAAAVSAHKAGGFAGSGALLLRGNARRLKPPWPGGGQEAGIRPGTEAWLLHAAFGAVCGDIEHIRARHAALASVRDHVAEALSHVGAKAIAGSSSRLPNTVALHIPEVDGEALRMSMDNGALSVGFGAACSAMAPEPSPSLLAMGLSENEARCTMRFSLGPDFELGHARQAIEQLTPMIQRLQARHRRRE